ncbi:hypothetical protein NOU13_23975 [Rhodococcus erythropolis]|uniref:hypothetical protein n=1 Tax=Rhodococcus erythropolis TaxID=1833 RepID=UPI00210BD055|nr:hypothetical protein [Rhodococcus erythropolis]MCQ4127566.1 hypothetical protein [Rhodococcus erythropolis]
MSESKKDPFRPSSSRSEQHDGSTPAEKAAIDQDLSELVDNLEEQVAAERHQEGVPGNRADRKDTPPIDTGDRAPD